VAGGAPRWWLRARYAGQGHELDVPTTPGDEPAALGARFADLHAGRFGFTLERPVEVVSARCAAAGPSRPLRLAREANAAAVWDPAQPYDAGGALAVELRGPATIALPGATLLVRPGWTARSLDLGGWLLERVAA
jgi:N-methylhydantoinase A